MAGPLSAAEAVPVAEFRAALRGFLRTSERNARAAGLTPQRYLLLLMIKGAPDGSEQSTVTELAERLQLAQSTVTELVSRAEEIGLVERERSSDDGRIAFLRLTDEGERRLAQVVHEQRARAPGARPGVRAPPGDRSADVGSGRARRDLLLPHLKRLRREGRESRDRAERRRLRGRGASREQRAVRRDRRRAARLLESRDRALPGRRRSTSASPVGTRRLTWRRADRLPVLARVPVPPRGSRAAP